MSVLQNLLCNFNTVIQKLYQIDKETDAKSERFFAVATIAMITIMFLMVLVHLVIYSLKH